MTQTVIRTISGKEQETAAELKNLGLVPVLPECRKMVRVAAYRRHREVIQPVLPCYLFADVPDDQHHVVKDIKHVVDVLTITRRDYEDVKAFLARVDRGDFNHSGAYGHLRPGEIMAISGGLFESMHLSFNCVHGGRVLGDVNLMGQTVTIDVDIDDVEIRKQT